MDDNEFKIIEKYMNISKNTVDEISIGLEYAKKHLNLNQSQILSGEVEIKMAKSTFKMLENMMGELEDYRIECEKKNKNREIAHPNEVEYIERGCTDKM